MHPEKAKIPAGLWIVICLVSWHSCFLDAESGKASYCRLPLHGQGSRFLNLGCAAPAICGTHGKETSASTQDDSRLEHALICEPMLGRPTDRSITLNVISLSGPGVYLKYGRRPGEYAYASGPFSPQAGKKTIDLRIEGLQPNTRYYYRIFVGARPDSTYSRGREGSFHTQRPMGAIFTFAITSDAHLYLHNYGDREAADALYMNTLDNILADHPDFLIDLGDLIDQARSLRSPLDPLLRYMERRVCLSKVTHSIPFYLVLGNHEAEQGWRKGGEYPIAEWCTLARKEMIPNPFPDGFYSGNRDTTDCCGLREDYYAWEWGDALFVVLDPFWYTTAEPAAMGAQDGWDWTLGRQQYEWLHETLSGSSARWKFVFAHHVTGGLAWGDGPSQFYGRGGIETVKYEVDSRPSFEWGGEDSTGAFVFDEKRPGWDHGPIHDIMVCEGVDIFFHGHDHAFTYQTLDGIVYQECPRPNDIRYTKTLTAAAAYVHGIQEANSGHIRVLVTPDTLRVDYVRSVLPDHDPLRENGKSVSNLDVTFSYTINHP